MQIGYSVQRGARRASSSLVPRLAPRGFPVRRGWRGGERQGWRVSAVRKGGGCAGCEKGHGRGRVTFPPLGSVLTSHRSDSRSGTKWWGAASLPRVDRVLGSAGGGRGALPRLLSPASRRVDSRSGGDGGAGSGRDGGSARCEKAGAARGAKKGTGGAGSPFPRWVASLPHIARIPGPARNGGARRPYPTSIRFPVQRGWWGGSGMQKGTGTGHGRRCALASARMTGRGLLSHVDRAPGSARGVGRGAHTEARGERTGRRGGHPPPTSIGLPVQRGEAGRGKGEVRADPAECNSPRTVRAGRFALDPGGYLSSRAVSSQVLSAYEGLTAVFGMGTGGTPQLNHRKLPVP